jgi:hypothetical protein
MTGVRTVFECGWHLRFLAATVSRLAFARRLATRLWNPEQIYGRYSSYAPLHSTICELDMRRLVWTTDCDIITVSLQNRAVESGVTSVHQPDYRVLTFYKAGYRLNQPLRLYVRPILRGHMALTQGRSWSESMTRTAISARTKS